MSGRSTTRGTPPPMPAPSKFMKPPTPTRLNQSRSFSMPVFVILAFIQCHHTRGCASCGTLRKPFNNSFLVWAPPAADSAAIAISDIASRPTDATFDSDFEITFVSSCENYFGSVSARSEEHTSELQSLRHL